MCFKADSTMPSHKICPMCGQRQDFNNKTCVQCDFAFPAGLGVKKRMRECPECGLEQPFTNRTCSQCGYKFPRARGKGAGGPKGPKGPNKG